MSAVRLLLAAAALAVVSGTYAQSTEPRGSTPPGMSQDGAKPADGAIKGGSILPGEMRERCEELAGTLREDCLRQQRDAGTGGTGKPLEERVIEPRTKSPERAD